MLNRFGVSLFSDVPNPPNPRCGTTVSPRKTGELGGDWSYREAVGSLIWPSIMTRADVSNAVCAAVHHSLNSTESYWKVVSRTMANSTSTSALGLTFVSASRFKFYSVLLDYDDKSNDRRSVSGIVIALGRAAVNRTSSTQRCLTFPTAEAECACCPG